MPPADDVARKLGALNDGAGRPLDWRDLRRLRSAKIVPSDIRKRLQASMAGKRLLPVLERAVALETSRGNTIFLAHGFHPRDRVLVNLLKRELRSDVVKLVTGEKPRTGSVARKVLDRIDSAGVFVALLSRDGPEPRPSPWIVSELGYAARKERIVLIERGVARREIGGIQGDVEYIRFDRQSPKAAFRKAARASRS